MLAPAYGCSNGCVATAPAGGFEAGLHYDYRRTVRAVFGGEYLPYRLDIDGVDLRAGAFMTTGLDVTLARWSWALLRASGRYQFAGLYRRSDDERVGTVQGGFLGLALAIPIPDKTGMDRTTVDNLGVSLSAGPTLFHVDSNTPGDHLLTGSLVRLEGEIGIQVFRCMFVDEACPSYLLPRVTPMYAPGGTR